MSLMHIAGATLTNPKKGTRDFGLHTLPNMQRTAKGMERKKAVGIQHLDEQLDPKHDMVTSTLCSPATPVQTT